MHDMVTGRPARATVVGQMGLGEGSVDFLVWCTIWPQSIVDPLVQTGLSKTDSDDTDVLSLFLFENFLWRSESSTAAILVGWFIGSISVIHDHAEVIESNS